MIRFLKVVLCISIFTGVKAQPGRWQQHIKYAMDVKLDGVIMVPRED